MSDKSLLDLADEEFVLLTTFRRSGERVSTPVWVARDGDRLVVITPDGTGKTKRIRANSSVEVTPCDRRGRPKPWATTVAGRAEVRSSAQDTEAARAAIKAKYRLQFAVFMTIERLVKRMRDTPRVALWITA